LNFGWLQDKKLRFVAKALPTLLGSIVLFAGLVNLFGYSNTAFLLVVVALVLWIVSTQAVEKISPSPRSENVSPLKTGTRGQLLEVWFSGCILSTGR
jgi:O-antigen ligase